MRLPAQAQPVFRDVFKANKVESTTGVRASPVAPPDCFPGYVWNPDRQECVNKGGCWGKCVLTSMAAMGLLNPFSYVFCVIKNQCWATG